MIDLVSENGAIETIVARGYRVLKVSFSADEVYFFIVYKFEIGFLTESWNMDYNQLEGIDITDFMSRNATLYANRDNFITVLEKTIESNPVLRIQFQRGIKWMMWDIAQGVKK